MGRTKILIKNAVWELGYYLIVIALGFLAPRYIILIYGSEVNGLSTTITQILNVILILQAGATTAAIFSLYKPIAENDATEISKNVYSAVTFFKRISFIFLGAMLIMAVLTALFSRTELHKAGIFIAFVAMGLKSFLDLFFTSKFRIVFTAFQEKFIISIATLLEQVVYYALVFLTLYFRLHYVFMYIWFFAGCIVKVLFLEYKYLKKYSKIIPKSTGAYTGSIKGRGYALANEVAHSVVTSSIAILLSFMYGFQATSVYSVYSLVAQALALVSTSLYSSFAPGFGNLVASENDDNTNRVFCIFQYLYVMLNSIMMFNMVMLIVPFAKIYTSGATDIDYENFTLACIMGISGICSAYRIPYNIVVSSCGFFKETWKQPVICIFISLSISVIGGAFNYSLILLGPAVFYLINFLYQHFRIKKLSSHLISHHVFTMFGISIFGYILSVIICTIGPFPSNLLLWLLMGMITVVLSTAFIILLSRILLPEETKMSFVFLKTHFIRSIPVIHK